MNKKERKNKKLRVGWFSFTCSEDSTIIMTELLNDYWQEWRKLIDFRYARILKSKNILDDLDVAFVEGAISSETQVKRLKKIREKSKRLVAIGSCAVTGMPSAQRNQFDKKTREEIQFILNRFAYLPNVLKVSEVVKVDAEVPGCPMDSKIFLKILNQYFQEFKIVK